MAYLGLEEQIQEVRTKDPRYRREAYFFLLEALDFTLDMLGRYDLEGEERHVGPREYLEGIREYAVFKFGPLAGLVLRKWGVRTTEDLGEIVFNMVDCGLLHSRPQDRKEDFRGIFDFEEAFSFKEALRIDWEDLAWE